MIKHILPILILFIILICCGCVVIFVPGPVELRVFFGAGAAAAFVAMNVFMADFQGNG